MEYGTKFMTYRDDLEKALTIHITLGVDAANVKLDSQSSQLQSIQTKLDIVFRKLDTPREREVLDFIEKNGGSKVVIERDDLVQYLVKKSGETMASLGDKSLKKGDDVGAVREMLRKELAEDFDVVLERNLSLFESKLEIQGRNLKEEFQKFFTTALAAGTHDKIKDSVSSST